MIADAHWRRGTNGQREAIAVPGDSASIAANYQAPATYWGKKTSREPAAGTRAALELAAFRLGTKPATLARALAEGLFDG